MKFCPKCGNAVPDNASFCPKCGTNIPDTDSGTTPAQDPTPAPQTFTPQQPPMEPCPPTYLALSIIVTVLCCLPFGIVGIIKSSNVSKEYAAGNYAKARMRASRPRPGA